MKRMFASKRAEVGSTLEGSSVDAACDCDRWVEIWNLVFMQFDRSADGKLAPLPKPSVDTGAGLERVSAVMQGVTNNYDIDIFVDLVREAARLLGTTDLTNPSLRVIADHIRACSFLIVDGVLPSNEGRGYVLRKIMRRAMRHGLKLGMTDPFLHTLVAVVVDQMGDAYPEIRASRQTVEAAILAEERQFADVLSKGLPRLEAAATSALAIVGPRAANGNASSTRPPNRASGKAVRNVNRSVIGCEG
jgi:alanyl-tRNA synthetase